MGNNGGLTVTEVAERLKVPKTTLRYWIHKGLFPNARKKNRFAETSPYIIPEKDIDHFLETQSIQQDNGTD